MAPAGKRKRNDRTFSHDEGQQGRPSPHRPDSLNLAQQNQRHDGGRNDRRRGGRGGGQQYNNNNNSNNYNSNAQPVSGPNATPTPSRSTPSAAPSPSQSASTLTKEAQPSDSPVVKPTQPSQPGQSTQPTPAPAPSLQPPRAQSPPREPPKPYRYEFLTDHVVAKWQESGKRSLVDAFSQAEDHEATASAIVQELIRSTVDDRIAAQDSGAALKDILEQQSGSDRQELQSLIADTINVLDERDWKRSSLRTFIIVSGISVNILREELDIETLQALGLVRGTFSTIRNRKTTNLIYRQANFNLLREESEGYSKLITEYFNISHVDNLSEPVAEDAFQRIKALVGSFDLDVGRVLDITLDLMANLLVKNFRFFVKFLRASSWWPEDNIPEGIEWAGQDFSSLPTWALPGSGAWNNSSEERERLAGLKQTRDVAFWKRLKSTGMDAFFQLGARTITNLDSPAVSELLNTELQPELNARGQDTNIVRRTRLNDARKWMRETACLPPLGNPDAAQILGFKLAFYASDARNKKDEMPENLIWMSALLIKIGFISLRDLYPHLYPPDEKMNDVKLKLEVEKEARHKAARPGGSAMNALAMAGALVDDQPNPTVRGLRDADKGANSPKPEDAADKDVPKPADDLPEPANQKILLLKSLLLIGALPEALFILGKFPWLADLVPDLPDHIHRILHHMLTKVYEPTRPLANREGLSDPKDYIGDPAGLPKGSLKFVTAKRPKSLRWANLERGDIGDETEYKFYWEDWADNIPVCQNVDDVFQMCNTILNYSGVKIGRDSALLMKLTRIGKKSLVDDRSEANTNRWIDLCKRLLVPALSLTKRNTGDVNEMFELLKLFPIATRFSIYTEWHFGTTSRNPDIMVAFKLTQAETRDVLKRISKTNVRAMGKALSKVAFSSPGVVMQVAIHQMESYDNLIDVVVECVRYFSMLGYDVLVWCLMTALGGGGRNRVQADGMLTSAWLRALSTFAGSIFKRYSAIDPAPILQYVANELRNGNSTDLEILEQIVAGMAGIRSDVTFNEAQVLAMAGGKVLQAQTLISVADERHKMEKTSKRLIKALTDPGLAGQLLISMAQERQMYPNHDIAKDAPLKVLGNNVDKINEVFNQYLDTLRSNLASKEFDAAVPDVVSLITDFGLEPAVAFSIGRASIAAAVIEHDASKEAEQQQERAKKAAEEKPVTNGDVDMTDTDEVNGETSAPEAKNRPGSAQDAEMKDAKEIVQANSIPTTSPTPALEPAGATEAPYWHPALSPIIEKMQTAMGSEFGTTVNLPFYVTFWSLTLEDILVNSASYEQELTAQNHLINQITNDRSDSSIKAVKEREAKKKTIVELKDRLTQEMREQIKTYQRVRGRLVREKAHWFTNLKGHRDEIYNSLWQKCFLPRLLLSPIDAHYTLTMIKFLHNNGAPDFRTMWLYDHLFHKNQLAALLYQCTSREAENLGRFLNELLKDLSSWHAKQETYEKNAYGVKKNLPGFAKGQLNPDGTPANLLTYEHFRNLLFKWHATLNLTFQLCFESGEYMHIRNAIIVLRGTFQHFPAITFMGNKMVQLVEKIGKEESRGDLKLAAMSLLGSLKRMEKTWIMPQAFHLSNVKLVQRDTGSSRSGTPAAGNGTPLNPAASDFKPVSVEPTSGPDGDSTRSEDGEIDEEKKEAPAVDKSATEASFGKDEPSQQKADLKPTTDLSQRGSSKAPASASIATPASISRPTSTQPHGRTPHALPSKPDTQSQAQRSESNRPGDRTRPARHDVRDRTQNQPDFGRLEPVESRVATSRSREVSPGRRSRARTPELEHSTDRRDHHGGPPRYDERGPPRMSFAQDLRMTDRDAAYGPPRGRENGPAMHQSRGSDIRGYSNGPSSMPPPTQHDGRYGRSDRGGLAPRLADMPPNGPPSNPGSQPGTPGVNPARLALITGEVPVTRDDRRSRDESRRDRDDRKDRGSRPQSPRRMELAHDRLEPKEERRAPLDPNPFASQVEQRGRRDEPRRTEPGDHTPTGPRSGRPGRNEPAPKTRDLFEAGPAVRRTVVDPSHGRLIPDERPPQDSNYGRLSQGPDVPSGPREFSGPVGRAARNFTPMGPSANPRTSQAPVGQPPAQSPSIRNVPMQPPANDRNSGRPQYDRPASLSSAPPGPALSPQQAPLPVPPGVHPSRIKRLSLEVQTGPSQGPTSQGTPSGPRNSAPTGPAASTPTASSPVGNRVPSGPSASAGDRRKFQGLNETLTSGGNNNNNNNNGSSNINASTGADRGASIRGRAGRQSGVGMGIAPSTNSVNSAPTGPNFGNQGQASFSGRPPLPPQQMPTPQQGQAPAMHPSRMESFGGPQGIAPEGRSGGNGRRDEDRGDTRHRSAREDDNNSASDQRPRHGHGPVDDYATSRIPRHNPRSDGRDRGDRGDRRGGHRDSSIMTQGPQSSHPAQFGSPQVEGYGPSPGRGYDNGGRGGPPPQHHTSGRGGEDYNRRDNALRGAGGRGGGPDDRRDDGRNGGGSSGGGGSGTGGRGDRKRRGDEMGDGARDRDRADKRRRSGM